MELVQKIEDLLKETFEKNSISHHKISFIQSKPLTLEICIAKEDHSMDLDTCEIVSKQISDILDANDIINSEYNLDVCSFGAEREIEINDINLYLDNYVHVELKDPKKGLDRVEGFLKQIDQNSISINYLDKGKEKSAIIDINNIRLIRLAVKI